MSKSCETCLYALTHEKCSGCLGNPTSGQSYAYHHWIAGDGVARLRQQQKSGERNIVIGSQGEAEVNVRWTPDEAYKNLFHAAEACGYAITKGRWEFSTSELELGLPHGHFRITWWNNQLHAIDQIIIRNHWHTIE